MARGTILYISRNGLPVCKEDVLQVNEDGLWHDVLRVKTRGDARLAAHRVLAGFAGNSFRLKFPGVGDMAAYRI